MIYLTKNVKQNQYLNKSKLRKYSANYSNSNHNFVIQNLNGKADNNEYLPRIQVLKNILQRGIPTLLSTFLQSKLGEIHKQTLIELSKT